MISRRMVLTAAALVLAIGGAQAQTRGGTLNVLVQPEPPTLMLGINQQGPVELVGSKIYQTLLTYDFALKPQPGLAKSWTQSPDGMTYTFKLQENVKWHDGKPFTSADVVFSTKTFLPEVNPRARAVLAHVADVEAPDAQTVVFKMKQPFGPFLGSFVPSNMPMVPKHIYEGTDFRTNPANQTPIGTGPFKFKEWQRGQYIHLVRNDDYWKPGLPYLDAIYFRVLPDASARAFALETQQADVAGPDTVASIKAYPYDPKKAEALLDEMGLKRGSDGMRVTLSFLPLPYGETWKRMGEYIKQALGRVGINVNLETTDPAGWLKRVANWDYQLAADRLQQFGDPAVGVARTYLSSNIKKGVPFNNTMGYENPAVDDLFARAAKAVNDDERQKLYSEVQKILVEDVPVAWMLEIKTPTIYNKKFTDVIATALGVNDSFESARLAK
jgi:ABC-type transport system substrate-binding protein